MTSMTSYVAHSVSSSAEIVCRKSWIAYARAMAFPAMMLLSAYPASLLETTLGFALGIVGAIGLLVEFAEVHSQFLFIDSAGVWEHSGIMPWAKGVRGLRWGDLQEMAFEMTAIGWLLNSHDLTMRHRYKASDGLCIDHVRNGHKAAERINDMVGRFQRSATNTSA